MTINLVNNGTVVPDEILICIPDEFSNRVARFSDLPNVRVVKTACKGQVRQRIEGFRRVQNELVIQLDDDIYIYRDCFEKLLKGINKLPENSAVSPSLVFEPSRASCYDAVHIDSRINRMIHGTNWFKPGGITRTAMNIGLNAFKEDKRHTEVEWLPGGCVLHRRSNLVLFDFYPFEGKAYYEDVIQSIHLKNKGVSLFIDKSAICGIDPIETDCSHFFFPLKSFNLYFPYRRHIVKLNKNSLMYLYIDGLFTYYYAGRDLFKKLMSQVRNLKQLKK